MYLLGSPGGSQLVVNELPPVQSVVLLPNSQLSPDNHLIFAKQENLGFARPFGSKNPAKS
mgnify:CR=1 FL=1